MLSTSKPKNQAYFNISLSTKTHFVELVLGNLLRAAFRHKKLQKKMRKFPSINNMLPAFLGFRPFIKGNRPLLTQNSKSPTYKPNVGLYTVSFLSCYRILSTESIDNHKS